MFNNESIIRMGRFYLNRNHTSPQCQCHFSLHRSVQFPGQCCSLVARSSHCLMWCTVQNKTKPTQTSQTAKRLTLSENCVWFLSFCLLNHTVTNVLKSATQRKFTYFIIEVFRALRVDHWDLATIPAIHDTIKIYSSCRQLQSLNWASVLPARCPEHSMIHLFSIW